MKLTPSAGDLSDTRLIKLMDALLDVQGADDAITDVDVAGTLGT